jgi:hypothetical protein
MSAPDVFVEVIDAAPGRSSGAETDTLFAVGEFDRGIPGEYYEITSEEKLADLGARTAISQIARDGCEAALREGVSKIYASRVVGPAATKASVKLFDQSGSADPGDVSLVFTAHEVGEWANKLNIETVAVSTDFKVLVSHDDDGALEESGLLADRTAAIAWASDYGVFSAGASNEDPRTQGPTGLAGGSADHAGVNDAAWLAAQTAFDPELGCGQIAAFGRTTATGHRQLLAQWENNRVALLDAIDTPTAASITAQTAAIEDDENAKAGQLLAPWAVIDGIAPSTTRQVPYSAIQAGIIARAGDRGVSKFAIGLTREYSKSDRDLLADNQVSLARHLPGQPVVTMDLLTVADPDAYPLWTQFQNTRLIMYARAKAKQIGSKYHFEQIDGQHLVFERLKHDLVSELCRPLFAAQALYGATEEEAFRVDVGDQVNTELTITAGRILASVGLKVSPGARFVTIQLARTAINQPV